MAADCIFCRIASGEIPARLVHSDDAFVAFHDVSPQAPTHVLVIPRRHVPSLADPGGGEPPLLGELAARAVRIARELGLAGGFRLVLNCGRDGGQSVGHVHLHLLGGRPLGWPPG
jgi:histidine triad (HIT) family protein